MCHLATQHQCRGCAIYRANVCKLPRDPYIIKGERDTEKVFGRRVEDGQMVEEFIEHHRSLGIVSSEIKHG